MEFTLILLIIVISVHGAEVLVPFGATPKFVIDAMMTLAAVDSNTTLVDLGCGDGRLVRAAARRGARRSVGVDLQDQLLNDARRLTTDDIRDRVEFEIGDMTEFDLSKFSVVTAYWWPDVATKFGPKILGNMTPGATLIMHE
jgi:ribosomal protein L11 methylase PrmA